MTISEQKYKSKGQCPERVDQDAHRVRKGPPGQPTALFDGAVYKRDNLVERCIDQLKQRRAVATRYARTATGPRPRSRPLSPLVSILLGVDDRL